VGVGCNHFIDVTRVGEFYGEHTSAGILPANEDRHILYNRAKDLQGKLLIIHGMLDDTTPVSATFQLVEALQKANKSFDLLLMPNVWHNRTYYTIRRNWDYLVEHLLGVEPPKDYLYPGNRGQMKVSCGIFGKT
jgi:hypothetical protein